MTEKKITIKKPAVAKKTAKAIAVAKQVSVEKYIEAIGRRKTSVARVRVYPTKQVEKKGGWNIIINDKPLKDFFTTAKHQQIVIRAFQVSEENIPSTIVVKGGGVNSQAEAIRLGFARILIKINPAYRLKLKALGYLKRDPRMVETKKYGSRKARRPQQWRKR